MIENQNQASLSTFGQHDFAFIALTLGRLLYHLADVQPQPNLSTYIVFRTDQPMK